MINKKGLGKGMTILIALLLFSGATVATGGLISDLGNTYGAAENTNLTTFSRMDEISGFSLELENKTKSGSVGLFDSLEIFFRGGYRALISLFSIPGIVGSIANDMQTASGGGLHIPGWAVLLIITSISLVILSVIIGAIFKKEV